MMRPSHDAGRLFDPTAPADAEEAALEGTLDSVTFRNEENGFAIARLRTYERTMVTILGTLLSLNIGEALALWGKWETHKHYGPQFRVTRYQVRQPATVDAMEKYLGSGLIHGIGPKTAKILVRYFGLETLIVIEEHPERLREVPGIGVHKAHLIANAWEEQREVRHIMLFLQGHGISATYATKIYREYGDQAIEIVSTNPYRLARDIFGIGFKTADRIAQDLGLDRAAPERLEAGIIYALQQAEDNGHCFLAEEALVAEAVTLLSPPAEGDAAPADGPTPEAIRTAIDRLYRAQLLVIDPDDPARRPVYLKAVFVMELQLARALRTLLATPLPAEEIPADLEAFVDALCGELGVTLAAAQRQAIVDALQQRALILTGGPGTGKTTTTRAILQAFLHGKRTVLLASPTGRAAKRLSEVTGASAITIHRLLEVDPKSFTFRRNAENPLDCDVLIVDEASMLDLRLAFALVRALPPTARLILVGDIDQLPSVGAGNVLRDLIASGVIPVVRLTEIFRQAAESTIITNAHRVNHGEMPVLPPTAQWQTADCLCIPQDDPEVAARKIGDVVARSLPALGYTREEIQVLTPMQRGTLGAQQLNLLLQAALNPAQTGVAEITRGQKTLRCGDRVIQTVNNYQKEVFNGDIGYIRHIDGEEKALIIAYPDREVSYDFDEIDELQLAYALTVHKSQGSEYPAVVLAIHTQHYLLLQRNLLYTALTRAKRLALLVGSKRAIAMAVRNDRQQERGTRLAARLRAEESTREDV